MRIVVIAIVAALPMLVLLRPGQAAETEKPNFVVILVDDMGFSDLGCYGGEIETPNLDRLAEGGLRFTQFYNTARCWPTRTCILSGYYAQQVGMDPRRGKTMPSWSPLLPHYLRPAGYRSYHSGKWHIMKANRPVADGGFDRSYRLADHNRLFSPQKTFLNDRSLPAVERDSGYYTTTAVADHAIGFLKQHAQQHAARPFFLYLAFNVPHFPLQALQADIDRYKDKYQVGWDAIRASRHKRLAELGIVDAALSARDSELSPSWNLSADRLAEIYGPGEASRAIAWKDLSSEQKDFQATKMAIHAAMVDRVDQEIGRLLEQLQVMGAAENTAIFFLSDNGASAELICRGDGHDRNAAPGSADTFLCLGPGWSTASNTPFRMHKSWVHEGGIATPLIVHWPRGIAARGELRHDVGHCIDFAPTLLELAGVDPPQKPPEAPVLPGRSLVPAFARDGTVKREYLFFSHGGHRGLRTGQWKVVSRGDLGEPRHWELYNLSSDRTEVSDVSADNPERANKMVEKWEKLHAQFSRQAELP